MAREVHIYGVAVQDFKDGPYDLLVSNPPYFPSAGSSAPNIARRRSRQDHSLQPESLFTAAIKLLKPKGRLALIWPYKNADQLMRTALSLGFHLWERVIVRPMPQKPPHRILFTFGLGEGNIRSSEMSIETNVHHTYSQEFAALTAPFYLPEEG